MNAILQKRTAGYFFLAFVAFFGLTYAVLGVSIHWPASLSENPAVVLPLLKAQYPFVVVGYYLFALTSLLLLPMAYALRHAFQGAGKPVWDLSLAIATIAVVLRIVAIFRWLTLMPALANGQIVDLSNPTLVDAIFKSFNVYLDGFGTHWGDQLFTGLWVGMVSALIFKLHKGLAIFGGLTFLVQIAASVLDFTVAPGAFLSVTQSLIYTWALAVAIRFLSRKKG